MIELPILFLTVLIQAIAYGIIGRRKPAILSEASVDRGSAVMNEEQAVVIDTASNEDTSMPDLSSSAAAVSCDYTATMDPNNDDDDDLGVDRDDDGRPGNFLQLLSQTGLELMGVSWEACLNIMYVSWYLTRLSCAFLVF